METYSFNWHGTELVFSSWFKDRNDFWADRIFATRTFIMEKVLEFSKTNRMGKFTSHYLRVFRERNWHHNIHACESYNRFITQNSVSRRTKTIWSNWYFDVEFFRDGGGLKRSTRKENPRWRTKYGIYNPLSSPYVMITLYMNVFWMCTTVEKPITFLPWLVAVILLSFGA